MDHVLDGAALQNQVETLSAALESRARIGQAVGVLVAVHRIDPDAAWRALSRTSQETNIKVSRLAPVLVELAAGATPLDTEAVRAVERLLPAVDARSGSGWRDRHALADSRDEMAAERDERAVARDRLFEIDRRAEAEDHDPLP